MLNVHLIMLSLRAAYREMPLSARFYAQFNTCVVEGGVVSAYDGSESKGWNLRVFFVYRGTPQKHSALIKKIPTRKSVHACLLCRLCKVFLMLEACKNVVIFSEMIDDTDHIPLWTSLSVRLLSVSVRSGCPWCLSVSLAFQPQRNCWEPVL